MAKTTKQKLEKRITAYVQMVTQLHDSLHITVENMIIEDGEARKFQVDGATIISRRPISVSIGDRIRATYKHTQILETTHFGEHRKYFAKKIELWDSEGRTKAEYIL